MYTCHRSESLTIEGIFHAATREERYVRLAYFHRSEELRSSFLTVCVINILDAVRLMTSAMIKPWRTAAITRNGRRMTDLDALVVVRISLVAWRSNFRQFHGFIFKIPINKPL